MLCQRCHKNLATVRYAEVMSGQVKELPLCPECLAKQQDESGAGFALSSPVPASSAPSSPKAASGRGRGVRICPSCEMHVAKVLDTGRVQCPACYEAFAGEIGPMLAGLHGGVEHCGKSPHMDDVRVRMGVDLQAKRALLRTAVEMEHYEEAARLRDAIQRIEKDCADLNTEAAPRMKDEG
jgi:protein arginine kinase activator